MYTHGAHAATPRRKPEVFSPKWFTQTTAAPVRSARRAPTVFHAEVSRPCPPTRDPSCNRKDNETNDPERAMPTAQTHLQHVRVLDEQHVTAGESGS